MGTMIEGVESPAACAPFRRWTRLLCVALLAVTSGCEYTVPTESVDLVEASSEGWLDTISVLDTVDISVSLSLLGDGRPVTGLPVEWSSSDTTVMTVRAGAPTSASPTVEEQLSAVIHATVVAVGGGVATIEVRGTQLTSPLMHEVVVLERWTDVTAGAFHSCGVNANHEAYCWGSSESGELGNGGSTADFTTPQIVLGDIPFSGIEAGYDHTCAQDLTRIPYCWGLNLSGELGTGNELSQFVPTRLALGRSFETLSLGNSLSCGVLGTAERKESSVDAGREDVAVCWGNNASGQLGQGTREDLVFAPDQIYRVAGSTKASPQDTLAAMKLFFTDVSAGGTFACGISIDDPADPDSVTDEPHAWCWGNGSYGQLGSDELEGDSVVTLAERIDEPALDSVWASLTDDPPDDSPPSPRAHACGLTSEEEAWCWGSNDRGQLGDGSRTPSGIPVLVDGEHTFTRLTLGEAHTCGLTPARELFCWGANDSGQLGNGTMDDAPSPVKLSGEQAWVSASAGLTHTCGRTDRGAIFCWGENGFGQLGTDSFDNASVPTRVAEPSREDPR